MYDLSSIYKTTVINTIIIIIIIITTIETIVSA